VGLDQVVAHRRLVLPQLGAVGVAAHEVKAATGFQVRYGPVLARDVRRISRRHADDTGHAPSPSAGENDWSSRPWEIAGAWKPALALLLPWQRWIAPPRTVHVPSGYRCRPFLRRILTGGLLVLCSCRGCRRVRFAIKGAVAGALCAISSMLLLPMGRVEASGTTLLF